MKRLIVHNSLLNEVVYKLSVYCQTKKIGNPLEGGVELGPLVAERQVTKLEKQIEDALSKGAKIKCGGKRPNNVKGAFFEPTILTNITKDMLVWSEEVFGPVLPVIGFETYEQAIELANDTEYGLSAIVFTNSKSLALMAMKDIKAGAINHYLTHTLRPQNPFGGYKKSGIGRQCGAAGFDEITQLKMFSLPK